jgi:hypothetical protein
MNKIKKGRRSFLVFVNISYDANKYKAALKPKYSEYIAKIKDA